MNNANRTCASRLIDGSDLRHHPPRLLADGELPGHTLPLYDSPLNDRSRTFSHGLTEETSLVTWYCEEIAGGHVVPRHHHLRAQLLYAVSGIMVVATDAGSWTVPPQQAVWIPAGVGHEVRLPCAVSLRSLYIRPERVDALPSTCHVVEVTPLLRELITRLVMPPHASLERVVRLMDVLIDEIVALQSPPLHLPTPTDPRLRTITDALTDDPADARELDDWAHEVNASTRTLARLFMRETGMGFRAWRQQRRLLAAIEKLAADEDVTRVALDLGYGSPSAFIAMFKRCLGSTPGRYLRAGR